MTSDPHNTSLLQALRSLADTACLRLLRTLLPAGYEIVKREPSKLQPEVEAMFTHWLQDDEGAPAKPRRRRRTPKP